MKLCLLAAVSVAGVGIAASADTLRFADAPILANPASPSDAISEERSYLGFTWGSGYSSIYGSYCAGGGALFAYPGYGYYGNPDCPASYTVRTSDGSNFDLSSVSINASDYSSWTDVRPVVYNSLGIVDFNWAHGGVRPEDPFVIIGYRSGREVIRQSISDGEYSNFLLRGFENIDAFSVKYNLDAYDYIDSDFLFPSTPATGHCYGACFEFSINGFEFHTKDPDAALALVPLPPASLFLLLSLGCLGLVRRLVD